MTTSLHSQLLARYETERAHTTDPLCAAVAARQLARLQRTSTSAQRRTKVAASRWSHVPVSALFFEAGNRLVGHTGGMTECGHEPLHSSKSGRCVLIDPSTGRWWCRSCRRAGDAATLVMDLRGCRYPAAVAWLVERFGHPQTKTTMTREVETRRG